MQIVLALGTDTIDILHVPTRSLRKSVSFCQRCWAGLDIAPFPRWPASGTLPLCSYVETKLIMHAKSSKPSQMHYFPFQDLHNQTSMLKQKLAGSPTFLARLFGSVPVFYGSAYAVSSSIFNIPTLAYISMTWRRSTYSTDCWTTRETSCFPYMLNHYIFTFNNMHLKHGVAWCPHSELQYFALINVAITANLKK